MIIWFTGLSGSGKTTLSNLLSKKLQLDGLEVVQLDGDTLRRDLCADLGFSAKDRLENLRRAGSLAMLLAEAGKTVICSLISPYSIMRQKIRDQAMKYDISFMEVYLSASLEVCESRDPKGLYKKARMGLIPDFTGINSSYEIPEHSELSVPTGTLSVEDSVEMIYRSVSLVRFQAASSNKK